jgi:hypothetical protein
MYSSTINVLVYADLLLPVITLTLVASTLNSILFAAVDEAYGKGKYNLLTGSVAAP